MMESPFSLETTVKDVLDRYPGLLSTFMDLGLLCLGCPTEAFHTLSDVARENHLDPDELLRRLDEDVREDES